MNCFHKAFVEDPEANPIDTPSGKYEIYCQKLKDYYDLACFNDIDALPKYKPSRDGAEQRDADETYPFQFYTPHHIRCGHSRFANVRQLNEVFANDLFMSEFDANKHGFKKGDWVQVSASEGGKLVRRINPIPNLMPGVTFIGQGNWRETDQASGVDIGGNVNTITRTQLNGDGYQAYNTVLVKIEPYSGKELLPDYKRPPLIPLAE
jgi:anaerobic dimethyl sulfoxide reductase subunit A